MSHASGFHTLCQRRPDPGIDLAGCQRDSRINEQNRPPGEVVQSDDIGPPPFQKGRPALQVEVWAVKLPSLPAGIRLAIRQALPLAKDRASRMRAALKRQVSELERLHSQPLYDVQSQLVYATRADQVTDVWIGGRHQLENARHVHIDTDTLLARANEWRSRIARTRDQEQVG